VLIRVCCKERLAHHQQDWQQQQQQPPLCLASAPTALLLLLAVSRTQDDRSIPLDAFRIRFGEMPQKSDLTLLCPDKEDPTEKVRPGAEGPEGGSSSGLLSRPRGAAKRSSQEKQLVPSCTCTTR
jgi:hypothetical protein